MFLRLLKCCRVAQGVTVQTKSSTNLSLFSVGVIPALVAAVAVFCEPWLTEYTRGRAAVLPLTTLLLLTTLVHPRLRYLLMITLCYGVSFLALRDMGRLSQIPLPAPLNYDAWDILRALDLLTVAALSATAGVYEGWQPGTVWARRCYFGAAAGYFIGLGIVNFYRFGSWQSLLLGATGVTAAIGCVFAHRIMETEATTLEEAQDSDEMLQQTRDAAHRARLHAKEWRDNLALPRDDRNTPSAGSAS